MIDHDSCEGNAIGFTSSSRHGRTSPKWRGLTAAQHCCSTHQSAVSSFTTGQIQSRGGIRMSQDMIWLYTQINVNPDLLMARLIYTILAGLNSEGVCLTLKMTFSASKNLKLIVFKDNTMFYCSAKKWKHLAIFYKKLTYLIIIK